MVGYYPQVVHVFCIVNRSKRLASAKDISPRGTGPLCIPVPFSFKHWHFSTFGPGLAHLIAGLTRNLLRKSPAAHQTPSE